MAQVYTAQQLDALKAQVQGLRQSARESRQAFEALLQSRGLDAQSALEALDQAPESLRQQADAQLRRALAAQRGEGADEAPGFLPPPGTLPASVPRSPSAFPSGASSSPSSPSSHSSTARLIGGRLGARI